MPTTTPDQSTYPPKLQKAVEAVEIALPVPEDRLEQDEEWVVVRVDGSWRRIRLHDYDRVYAVPGLYEKWVYEVFQCRSPQKVRELLSGAMDDADVDPGRCTVLDLGAGNGYVANELRPLGIRRFVGVDIVPAAAAAARRDRPGLYDDYVVGDLLALDEAEAAVLNRYDFDVLTCVAALGFGDIPPDVFGVAFDRIALDGWIAFTIKTDFLDPSDDSGFATMIRRMLSDGALELDRRETYTHRTSNAEEPLLYDAFVGRKRGERSA